MDRQEAQHTPRGRLLAALSVTAQRVDVDGTSTSVLSGGQGPPLMLLHGGIQAGGVVWWRVADALAERHRVVIPDLPGFGESAPQAGLDAPAVERWLRALVAEVCDEPPTLVAHSAPGGLAARFASHHGSLLRRLVLVDAAGLARFRPSPGFLVALLRSSVRPSPQTVERFLARVTVDLAPMRQADGELWEAFVADVAARAAVPEVRRAMRQTVRAGTRTLDDAELADVTAPTALLWGRRDPLIPVAVAQAASSELGWPLQIVEGAGHLPHVEQPEAFVAALTRLMAAT